MGTDPDQYKFTREDPPEELDETQTEEDEKREDE